jgi:hypothetical protein
MYSQTLKLEEIMKGNALLVRNQKTKRWSIDGQKNILIEPNNELGNSNRISGKKACLNQN